MQLEVGTILEGKVTGITKFGAFVELPDKMTGMVHISEVAATFVKEIRDFVTEGQTVKVKVLSIGEDGKISLSIKKAQAPAPRQSAPRRPAFNGRPGDYEWQTSAPLRAQRHSERRYLWKGKAKYLPPIFTRADSD